MRFSTFQKPIFMACILASSFAKSQQVGIIPPGIIVSDQETHPVWDSLILEASAELSEGEVHRLSNVAQENANLFGFTIMASIDRSSYGGAFISAVGIAMTMKSEQQTVTVSRKVRSGPVAGLGFISRMVLYANEQALENIFVLNAKPKYVLIQAPTIMHYEGKNQEVAVRYLIALDDQSRLKSYVWPVIRSNDENSGTTFAIREFEPGVKETRKFHVDGNEVTLGIPSKMAFGLLDLPPGVDITIRDPRVMRLVVADVVADDELHYLAKFLATKGKLAD